MKDMLKYRRGRCSLLWFFAVLFCSCDIADAGVTWQFTETSLINIGTATPVLVTPPTVIVTLTVSNADFFRGSLSYSFQRCGVPSGCGAGAQQFGDETFHVSGDRDFLMTTASHIAFPEEPNSPSFVDGGITASFDRRGGIDVSIFEDTTADTFLLGDTGGEVSSDLDTLGCPDSQCSITGFWTLTSALPVAEPSSLALLAAALAFGLGLNQWRSGTFS